jgi:hypothetical protein
VSPVTAALTRFAARLRGVCSCAPRSAFATGLSGCAFPAGSTVATAPGLEQRRFDAHAAVVGNQRERAATSAAFFAAVATATRQTACTATAADPEREDEITAAARFAAVATDSSSAWLSAPAGIAGIARYVTSELDPAETEERRRTRGTVGALCNLREQ